ncbi:hypothetical protein [Clostridium sp. BL-8]|uniref:hypothetical protein n=1 Tax=Clostridium sp. BL-8 TaxID=349938 RepID=UPI00098C7885|nr:hypothetical protein [Clostridium sp. BL-8]OOM78225.1 hypothetical protein CLOBL_24770 [Clostridium sp. BL-8]
MAEEELLITYGVGYAFEKSKLLIVSEIEEKVILKRELDILKEINVINKFQESLHEKCDSKFPKNYIVNVEEALEEKLSKTIPIITSIKTKNAKKQDYLMDEYIKRDLSQIRLRREGYIQKDSNLIKEYLDTCSMNFGKSIEEKKENILKYNKIILKFILTSSVGNDFSDFLKKQGQAVKEKIDQSIGKKLEDVLESEHLIKKKYKDLDFLNLLLFLEEWQKKYFTWDGKYTSLMSSISKDGKKYSNSNYEIKESVISFIKKNKYLYFTFGRYNKENIFITLNHEKYCKKNQEKGLNSSEGNEQRYMSLEKKEGNLYEITSNDFQEIDLDYNKELGYLLSYDDDENVHISLVIYDKKNEEVTYVNKYDSFKNEMIKALEEHFIL